jgi:prolyl-tRNA editing enzyme YbaK/EbsC (Cys-tRNA(Pro) deacylase)
MAIEKVRAYFEAFGIAGRVLEFDVGTATVAEAAAAMGCAGQRIAKTLAFKLAGGCALIVAAGDARIDNARSAIGTSME